ncbi:MAG: class I SAM-dependent methyltransferase [Magnetococcus sp. YQC-5]
MKRDFSRLDAFLDTMGNDVYPEVPSEPHLSITRSTIQALFKNGIIRPGMRVLDVGCGQGLALELFQENGLDAMGITLGADYDVCISKGFQVMQTDQNFMAFEDNTFDFLWCRHVLEHSVMPFFTLTEYGRVTKPKGLVYVEIPAPDTSAHHEMNQNHYSVLPFSLWEKLFAISGFAILDHFVLDFTANCGPDTYWSFLLQKKQSTP